jgi:hypothetical protein
MNIGAVIFYGDVSPRGYRISYLLLDRQIKHEFVLFDGFILSIQKAQKLREFNGFDRITRYLENYEYLKDFGENEWGC